MNKTDLSFITNEEQQNLKARFRVLVKDTKFLDCLVGYFYTSGFHAVHKSLENTEKIRILISISTNKLTYDLLTESNQNPQQSMQFSYTETNWEYSGTTASGFANLPLKNGYIIRADMTTEQQK